MKVSVIVPVYNAEAYLSRCIDSILGQTLTQIEIVLVDDGSTDGSGATVDAYAARDPRVKAIHTENRGPADARHTGVQAATGEYITFQDSDDHRPLDALERLYAKARESGADVVSGNYWVSRFAGSPDFVSARRPVLTESDSLHAIRGWFDGTLRGGLCTSLFRRELYTENVREYLPVKHGEDGIVLVQMLAHARKTVQLNEPVYYYVLRKGSLCHYDQQWSRELIDTYAQVTRWMLDYLERIPGKAVFADALASYALYRLSLLQIKRDGREIDFHDLETRIYRNYYGDPSARRWLRKAFPKQWIFLVAERRRGWRWVRQGLWGNPVMRSTLRTLRKVFRKIGKNQI
jgi:glycosyltransferase EpsH